MRVVKATRERAVRQFAIPHHFLLVEYTRSTRVGKKTRALAPYLPVGGQKEYKLPVGFLNIASD
jgi:hypothetical protein